MPYLEINEDLKNRVVKFSGDIMVSRGQVHQIKNLDGYVYLEDEHIIGCVLYLINGHDCEIISIESRQEGQGVGSKLIQLVIDKARNNNCNRVWLITSNDNINAIRFYQKRGFDMIRIHRNAITEARRQKPTIPMNGYEGIPIKHEVEFEYIL